MLAAWADWSCFAVPTPPNALGRPPCSGVPRRYTPPLAVSVKHLYLHWQQNACLVKRCETSLSPLPPSVRNRLDGRSLRAVVRTPSLCRYASYFPLGLPHSYLEALLRQAPVSSFLLNCNEFLFTGNNLSYLLITLVNDAYKPTYNWGASHCRLLWSHLRGGYIHQSTQFRSDHGTSSVRVVTANLPSWQLAATNIQNREMRDWQFFGGKLEKIDQYIPSIFHPTNHHVLVNDFNGHLLGPQKSTLLRMFLDDTFPQGKRTEARLRISTLSRRHEWDIGGSVSLGERNKFRVKPIKINIRNNSWVFSVLWIYMGVFARWSENWLRLKRQLKNW